MVDVFEDMDIVVESMNVNELRWIVFAQRKLLGGKALTDVDIDNAPSKKCVRVISVVLAEAALASIMG